MGCFHSVQRTTAAGTRGEAHPYSEREPAAAKYSEHEFVDVEEDVPNALRVPESQAKTMDAKFYDVDGSRISSPISLSSEGNLVDSAIAEFASSDEQSSGYSDRPVSPDLVVSPNPPSPHNASSSRLEHAGKILKASLVSDPGHAEAGAPSDDFKSAAATPLQSEVIPEEILINSMSSGRLPIFRSRLMEVAEAKRKSLILQVFTVWRIDILKSKVDSQRFKLEDAARASDLILSENERLKARLDELEHAITIVQSIPTKSVSTSTSDTRSIPIMRPTVTPPPSVAKMVETSAFMTPPSRGTEIPAEFVTPDSSYRIEPDQISMATPTTIPVQASKKSWEEYLRPSARIAQPVPPFAAPRDPVVVAPSSSSQPPVGKRDKLKAITQDLFKLSESLQAVDLKRKDKTFIGA